LSRRAKVFNSTLIYGIIVAMDVTKPPAQTERGPAHGLKTNMLVDLVRLIRPNQWVKNVFIFPALVFAQRSDSQAWLSAGLAFVAFCLLSSGTYALNDVLDREEDRLHPRKRSRPIAAGRVSVGAALLMAFGLTLAGLAVAAYVHRAVAATGLAYVLLMLAYNLLLKHHVLLDVITIALGFLLRAVAGGFAVQVLISPWLLVCTFTLCLFLGFGKRQCELAAFNSSKEAANHRATLIHYSPHLLSHLLTTSAGIAIVTFLFYTLDPQTQAKFHSNLLIYTTPLVFYGVFRYTMLVQGGRASGPNEILLNDKPFLLTVLAWSLTAVAIVYYGPQIESTLRVWLNLNLR
jgi:4-hydroxybenzoate polyprenyltransferase